MNKQEKKEKRTARQRAPTIIKKDIYTNRDTMFGRDSKKREAIKLPDINFSRYQQVKNINSRFSGTGGSKI